MARRRMSNEKEPQDDAEGEAREKKKDLDKPEQDTELGTTLTENKLAKRKHTENAIIPDDDVNDDDKDSTQNEEGVKRKRKRKRKKKTSSDDPNKALPSENATPNEKMEAFAKLSDREVYVEGLPFDCTEHEVKYFFVKGGCEDVIQMRLPRWQDSGRLRGYGHIVFGTTESRDLALSSLSGKNIKTRYITIAPSKQPASATLPMKQRSSNRPQPEGCTTLFVKNLPYDISESELESAFRHFGKFADGGVRLALNHLTMKPKGFGYVQFKNPEGAASAVEKAISSEGIVMKGRMLFVDYEEGGMKASFKTTEGKLWSREHNKGDGVGEYKR